MTVKLILKDEINIKITGLSLDLRKKLNNLFKYEDPKSRFSPARRLGRWDGMVSLFGIGGDGYYSQLDEIIEILTQHGVLIEDIEDNRSNVDLNFNPITDQYWADRGKNWPTGHPNSGESIVLHPHQVDAANIFLKNPQALVTIPTSGGKTLLTATLAHICESLGRTILIVPNKSLVVQTLEDYNNLGLDVGVYFGDSKDLNRTHTICTWQSLNILEKNSRTGDLESNTLSKFLNGVKTVMVDECHRASGAALQNLLTRHIINAPIRWGLTGTLPKEKYDLARIVCSIGPVVSGISAKELQDRGVLSRCHINIIQMIEILSFNNYQEELSYLVTHVRRLQYIAKLILSISETGNTLVLVDRIETGNRLLEMIPDTTFISGSVKVKDRKKEFDEINMSNHRILIASYGTCSTGINIVNIYNLVLLEPGKSFIRTIQSIGRGLRRGIEKDHVEIYDITSTCQYSKRHLTERKRFFKEMEYPFTIQKVDWQAKN